MTITRLLQSRRRFVFSWKTGEGWEGKTCECVFAESRGCGLQRQLCHDCKQEERLPVSKPRGNLRCEKRRFLRNVAPKIKMLPSCCECSCTKYTRWAQILCFLTISLSVLVQSCFQTNTFTNRSFWIQIIFFPLPHDTTALTSASTVLVSSFGVEQTEPSHSEQHNTKFRCEFVV